jgi:hypothetical protein
MAILLSMLAIAVPGETVVQGCPPGKAVRDNHCYRKHPKRHSGHHKGCRTYRCDRRVTRKVRVRQHNRMWKVVRPLNGYLESIAMCESGGRWHIATGNGFYGGLQFTASSWWSVGGRGYAHQATPLEQKYRAVRLARVQGWGAWPKCS